MSVKQKFTNFVLRHQTFSFILSLSFFLFAVGLSLVSAQDILLSEKVYASDEALVSTTLNSKISSPLEKPSTDEKISTTVLELQKLDDESGQRVAGAVIEVRNGASKLIFRGSTSAVQTLKIGEVLPGDYSYQEVLPAKGYYLNQETYKFTVVEGETSKLLNLSAKKIPTLQVCRIHDNAVVSIPETEFNIKDYWRGLDDCQQVEVCDLKSNQLSVIKKENFDSSLHSKETANCQTNIEVCEINSKKLVNILDADFDEQKHSRNLEDCKMEVCQLNTKTLVQIDAKDFDERKHSKNRGDCQNTPAKLPRTGPVETVAALIAVTAVTLSTVYWYKSHQAVRRMR